MKEKEIIAKLNMLKSIKPENEWLIETKNMVLSDVGSFGAEILSEQTEKEVITGKKLIFNFNFGNLLATHRKMAYAFASVAFVLSAGAAALDASKASLPGESLYHVKIAGENVVLAVTPESEKAKVEIEYAGKRLDELAKISEKPANDNQHIKINQLISDYDKNVNSAKNHLAKEKDSGNSKKAVEIAKVINNQSEKYTEALTKTTENMSDITKEKVSEKIAKAIVSTEKANTSSLLVLIEQREVGNSNDISDEEITEKIKKKIEKVENSIKVVNNSDSTAISGENSGLLTGGDGAEKNTDVKNITNNENNQITNQTIEKNAVANDIPVAEEPETKMELVKKARENIENNQLLDAMKSVAKAEDMEDIEEKEKIEIPFVPIIVDENDIIEDTTNTNAGANNVIDGQ